MKRYKVRAEFELMADGQDEAALFVESTYGDLDPEPQRVLTMEVVDSYEVETPDWVVKAAKDPDRR